MSLKIQDASTEWLDVFITTAEVTDPDVDVDSMTGDSPDVLVFNDAGNQFQFVIHGDLGDLRRSINLAFANMGYD